MLVFSIHLNQLGSNWLYFHSPLLLLTFLFFVLAFATVVFVFLCVFNMEFTEEAVSALRLLWLLVSINVSFPGFAVENV